MIMWRVIGVTSRRNAVGKWFKAMKCDPQTVAKFWRRIGALITQLESENKTLDSPDVLKLFFSDKIP